MHCKKNSFKDNEHTSLHLAWKYAWIFVLKEIKSSLKQKGISVTVKPTDWIEVVEVLYTAGYQGTMQTIV